MKATGIVRKVDELGRVVIPIELRRGMGIEIKDPLEIYVDDDRIILKKHRPNLEIETVLNELKSMIPTEDDEKRKEILLRAINLIK